MNSPFDRLRVRRDPHAEPDEACGSHRHIVDQPGLADARRRHDLLPPTSVDLAAKLPLVALAAARIGKTRLIDNLEIDF